MSDLWLNPLFTSFVFHHPIPTETMNQVFNAYNNKTEMRYDASKQKFVPAAQDSLFGLALAEFGSDAEHQHQQQWQTTLRSRPSGTFHPVDSDEYKDVSLREILDITDDFLFDDVDATAHTSMPASSS
eukprot:scaffold11193_cov166-Amphora_coffeaeformis.AAC.1